MIVCAAVLVTKSLLLLPVSLESEAEDTVSVGIEGAETGGENEILSISRPTVFCATFPIEGE